MSLPLNFESSTLREISSMIRHFVLYTDFILDSRLCFFEYLLNPSDSVKSPGINNLMDDYSQQQNTVLTIDSQWKTSLQNMRSRSKWSVQHNILAPKDIRDCLFLYTREAGQSNDYVGNFYMKNAANISDLMQQSLAVLTNTHVHRFLNDLKPTDNRNEQENILRQQFNDILKETGTVYFTTELCTSTSVGQDFNSSFFNAEQELLHVRKKMNQDVIEYLNILCHPLWGSELSKNYREWFVYLTNLEQLINLDKNSFYDSDFKKWSSAIRNQELLLKFNSPDLLQHPLNHVVLFRKIKSHLVKQNILIDFFLLINKKSINPTKKLSEKYWYETDSETVKKCYSNPIPEQLNIILYFLRFQRNLLVPNLYIGMNNSANNLLLPQQNNGLGIANGGFNSIGVLAGGRNTRKKSKGGKNNKMYGGMVNQHLGFTPLRRYLLELCNPEYDSPKDIPFSVFGKDDSTNMNPLFFDSEFSLKFDVKEKEHETLRSSWCGNSFGCALFQFLYLFYKQNAVQFIRTTLYENNRFGMSQESLPANLSFFFAIRTFTLYPNQNRPLDGQPDKAFAIPCLRNSAPPLKNPLQADNLLQTEELTVSGLPDQEEEDSKKLDEEIQKKSLQLETLQWLYLAPFFRFYMPTDTYKGYIEDTGNPDNVFHNIFNENTIYHLESCRDGKAYLYSPYNLGNKYPYDNLDVGNETQSSFNESPDLTQQEPQVQTGESQMEINEIEPQLEQKPEIIAEETDNSVPDLETILGDMDVDENTA